jgi:glycosyltransferase involved in cell wall biosynthesis
MTLSSQPLVSVVTPLYNAEKYLAECIESVLAQTYRNWEYIIVNNHSRDDSLAIAEAYAQRDARIRVVNNREFLPMIPNWNHALRQISEQSQFCKVVHADDWLFPECIERMVEVALQHPTVGIVSAYRLNEDRVDLDGLPYPSTVVPGRVAGRLSLASNPLYLFGSPTSILIRSDLIRRCEAFYDESLLHADTDACLRLLQKNDLGFVHQLLTYTRRHNESVSSTVHRLATIQAERMRSFERYGPIYLDEQEYRTRRKEIIQGYHHMLARHLFGGADKEFWRYHTENMANLAIPFQWQRMIRPLLLESVDALVHFKRTARSIAASLQAIGKRRHKQETHAERLQVNTARGN